MRSEANRSKHPLYRRWIAMKSRCYNKNDSAYHRYGGRGIRIHQRYLDPAEGFENLLADLGPKPPGRHSVDRINPDGDYAPENIRWATDTQQARNRYNQRLLHWQGKAKLICEWAEDLGIPEKLIVLRLWKGWSVDRALGTPWRKGEKGKPGRCLTWRGKTMTVRAWSIELGVPDRVLHARLQLGWKIEDVLGRPYRAGKMGPVGKELTWRGQTRTLAEWSELTGIPRETLGQRIRADWSAEAALTTPYRKGVTGAEGQRITWREQTKTIQEWSALTGIPAAVIRWRLHHNWSVELVLTRPCLRGQRPG
jgi:hypothetical protein